MISMVDIVIGETTHDGTRSVEFVVRNAEKKLKIFAGTIVGSIVRPDDGVAGWREPDTLEEYRPGCASFAARSLRNFT